MGVDLRLARASLLFTLGKDNTAEEINYTAEAYRKVVGRLREMSPDWQEFQKGRMDSVIARGQSDEIAAKPVICGQVVERTD
jgi:hypothetical protein